jgi:hypothetical protein
VNLPRLTNAGSIRLSGSTDLSGKIVMSRKAIGLAAVLLAGAMISGCNQNQKTTEQKNGEQKTTQQELVRGGGHRGLRKVCADDIQKFCANEDRKRRCLKDHMDQLSDTCKAAVEKHGGGRNRDKDKDNNSGDDNDND